MQKQLSIPTQEPTIQIINNQLMVSSLEVAEKFSKAHHNVIKAIERLDIPNDFNHVNFNAVTYTDTKGEKRKAYNITRDGFVILVMGFTGKEAMQWKIRYIQAFNVMEAQLLQKPQQLQIDGPSTVEARKPITKMLAVWVGCAPITYREAWQMVHAHFGVSSVEELKLSQIQAVTDWIQERIDAACGQAPAVAYKLSAEYEAVANDLTGLYEKIGGSYFIDLDVKNPDSPVRLINDMKLCFKDTLRVAANYDKIMVQLQKFEADYLRFSLFRKMLGEGK